MKKALISFILLFSVSLSTHAAEYMIDKKGMHAFIQFKISHLGYSWLYGRFNDFEGTFNYDKDKPSESSVEVTIQTNSVDSNHAERDKHLRSDDFLEVEKFPEASFVSKSFSLDENGKGVLVGDFTLRGITKELSIDVEFVGEGSDPWGGYRAGFQGNTSFALADFGIVKNLGPKSKEVELILSVEGVRK